MNAAAIAFVALLWTLSGVLALAETAFTRVNRIRLLALADEGDKRARRVARLLERPEQTLNSILLLVLGCQMIGATILGTVLEPSLGAAGIAVGIFVEIFVVFTLFEVVPKTFALQHSERTALAISPLLSFVTRFWPLRMLSGLFIGFANVVLPGKGMRHGPFTTEADILTMADVAAQEDTIETEERELIHSIFQFGDTVVREVMLPRTDMVAVEADATVDEAIAMAIEAGKSRLPAYEGTYDDIVGLVFLKDLVARSAAGEGAEPVRASLRSAHVVPESKRVAELLREMQTEKFHMAIVVDEYGGTAGLVTMEDLLEEIVGEITDEYDVAEPVVEKLANGVLRVPGRTPIDDVNELLDADLPRDEWDTVGGLVFNTLGHVPIEGECLRVDGLEFCAERVQGRRIVSVVITRLPSTVDRTDPDSPDRGD
ncbi:MAG: magnesium and cobalt exporter, family [Actinomycetota bacterium]|nr:magnesium and cobalt exporter, family [Actinomycetota bacterium]MDQ1474921.1 magnesium and cobalt exporter, family [Actinomycetota bacterium]